MGFRPQARGKRHPPLADPALRVSISSPSGLSRRVRGINSCRPGSPPETASLFLFDVKEQRIVGRYTPLHGAKVLLGVAEVSPGRLVGVGVDDAKNASTVYRFNLETGATEQARVYAGLICGKTGTLGVPVRSHDFQLGPDGKVWSGVEHGAGQTLLFRLNPADLGIEPVGVLEGGHIRLLFEGGRVYLSGAQSVRRVKELPVGVPHVP